MKSKISAIVVASVLAFSLLLSACGAKPAEESATPEAASSTTITVSPTPSASPSPSATPRPVPSPLKTVTVNGKYPFVVEAGNAVLADLNGDGKQDEVYYEATGEETEILRLYVDKEDYTESIWNNEDIPVYCPEPKYYCITDIDTSDNMLEIAIMDWGPSDDYTTSFFRYDGNKLKYIGYVCGNIVSSFSDESDLTFNGDGTIGSYIRLSVLQTWWAKVNWKLTGNGFEYVPQDLYYPKSESGCNVTTLADIIVYDSNSIISAKTTLPTGTALTLKATDNKVWVLAKTSDGKQVWIHLDGEYGWKIETPDGYKDGGYYTLSGLFIAD